VSGTASYERAGDQEEQKSPHTERCEGANNHNKAKKRREAPPARVVGNEPVHTASSPARSVPGRAACMND